MYFYKITFFQKFVNIYFSTHLGAMAHNVPAVYDVLPARIRALRSKTWAGKMCRNEAWEGAQRLT
jgi:hypothetical protein